MGENGMQLLRMENQGLLREDITAFAVGADAEGRKLSCVERSQHAIVLLKSLPCARSAVLEQICEVFHEAVHKYVLELERQKLSADHTSLSHQHNSQLDEVLHSVHDILMDFITTNTSPWAPLILKWSVNLLGQLSKKYAYKGVLSSMTLAERLQMWLSCPATQMLMEISTQCFARLISTSPDLCVDYLLDCAVQYAPDFDWVVAHLGSFFHQAIIACLLTCARKEFSSSEVDKSLMVSTVVRVLNHLTVQHSTEVKTAILAQFKETLSSSCGVIEVLKFLLHLASLSSELVGITATDFIEILTPDVLVKLHHILKNSESDDQSLLSELVKLIIRTDSGSYQILMFLINSSTDLINQETTNSEDLNSLKDVQETCANILELTLCQLQDLTIKKLKQTSTTTGEDAFIENPFLTHLQKHVVQLCQNTISAKDQRLKWLQKIIFLVGANGGQEIGVEFLYYILLNAPRDKLVHWFVELQAHLEYFHFEVLSGTIQHLLSQVKSLACNLRPVKICQLFENLHSLLQFELANVGQKIIRSSLQRILQEQYESFITLLHHTDDRVALVVLQLLLDIGNMNSSISPSCHFHAGHTITHVFFKALHKSKRDIYRRQVLCCKDLMVLFSENRHCQNLLIRQLVEGALHQENTTLFGGQLEEKRPNEDVSEETSISLIKQNRNPQNSSRLPLTATSVFYAGVIGKGVKKHTVKKESAEDISIATKVFIQTLCSICEKKVSPVEQDTNKQLEESEIKMDTGKKEDHNTQISIENAEFIATVLLEKVCPDILPVIGAWPEEELHKCNIERDLKMRNMFERNPLLWILLEFVSEVIPGLCKCSVIIHSLLAQSMFFWEASRLSKASHSKKQLKDTQRILGIIAEAGWLPKPLCYVGEIFEALTPKEVFSIVSSIWKFLKDNPPKPELFCEQDKHCGLSIRVWPDGCADAQMDLLNDIFFTNIADLGYCYARFFPVSSE